MGLAVKSVSVGLWWLLLGLLLSGCSILPGLGNEKEQMAAETDNPSLPDSCPAPGEWHVVGETAPLSQSDLLEKLTRDSIVLLGERHSARADHHWQLHLMAALHGRFEGLAVGYEMFVREQQPVLDAWLDGRISDRELQEQSDWDRHWGMDFSLYEPLLRFNRLQKIPARALNVPRDLVRRIGRDGWESVPEEERYGLSRGAEPPQVYRDYLAGMAQHPGHEAASEEEVLAFIRAQGVWDRAMAEGLSAMADKADGPVVGIVGRGHVVNGHGIPYQLEDLGETSVWVLLPWREGDECLTGDSTPADALYGLPR
ncbi:MAG: ChaN family lipoprotein [Oleiphilaceae bacterium]|nr:ChaN family lipoprotein [Oleiphilaceae bacterium]